jgi:glycerol kinase
MAAKTGAKPKAKAEGKPKKVQKYIMAIDEGTTGIRAIIFDKGGNIISLAYEELKQYYPQSGWVEQDAEEIWEKCVKVVKASLEKASLSASDIAAIGITNQRSTNVLWDRRSGKPICRAITWQDVRTVELCNKINKGIGIKTFHAIGGAAAGLSRIIKSIRSSKSGAMMITVSRLGLNPTHASSHTRWMLDNVKESRQLAKDGFLLFGTMDTWLVWKLTGGKVHATDYSNAASTGMYDPFNKEWSSIILGFAGIPTNILPEVRDTSGDFGETCEDIFGKPIPIRSVFADQQSALFGEACFGKGEVKVTNGTGTFIDMNVGSKPPSSIHGMIPLIAWSIKGETTYMLEGMASMAGSAINWLKNELQMIKEPGETETLAKSVPDTGGIYFVPAFTGFASPYWDAHARGALIGISRGTTKAHIVRSVLEGLAYQSKDIIETMKEDTGVNVTSIKADGGVSRNNFLLQFLSDVCNVEVERQKNLEVTALGAAYMAGLAVGYWQSKEDIKQSRVLDVVFKPAMTEQQRKCLYKGWKRAVKRAGRWTDPTCKF